MVSLARLDLIDIWCNWWQVYITDGLKFVKEAASESVDAEESGHENVEKKKIDILMIDVDNNDTR